MSRPTVTGRFLCPPPPPSATQVVGADARRQPLYLAADIHRRGRSRRRSSTAGRRGIAGTRFAPTIVRRWCVSRLSRPFAPFALPLPPATGRGRSRHRWTTAGRPDIAGARFAPTIVRRWCASRPFAPLRAPPPPRRGYPSPGASSLGRWRDKRRWNHTHDSGQKYTGDSGTYPRTSPICIGRHVRVQ